MNKKNIEKLIKKIIDPENSLKFEFVSGDNNGFKVEFYKMYDKPKITFDKLSEISKKFGTKLIDISDGRSNDGCETCDYGSSYGVLLTITKPTKNI